MSLTLKGLVAYLTYRPSINYDTDTMITAMEGYPKCTEGEEL
jgi:hypothetical protein